MILCTLICPKYEIIPICLNECGKCWCTNTLYLVYDLTPAYSSHGGWNGHDGRDWHAVVASAPPMREDPPSYREVEGVVSELKGGRAAGVCGIPAELLKAGGDSMTWWFRAAIVQVSPRTGEITL